MLYTKPANLQKRVGKLLDANERDKKRTEIIKQITKKQIKLPKGDRFPIKKRP